MIKVTQLCKKFKDNKGTVVEAVSPLSFTCEDGQVFGLLGPNGAGKTTTLRMLSTILKPTSGTATICGIDLVQSPRKIRTLIGFLSGNTGVYGRLTAQEMVTYFGRLYGMEEDLIKDRINILFSMLEMNNFASVRNEKLSTGMKQKVSIARSILHDPKVIIMDEPTTGLDVMSSRTIVSFIRKCREEGKCVVLSTHIMSEAQRLCDKLAIIHKGKIYFEGTISGLLDETGQDNLEEAFIAQVSDKSD